MGSTPPRTLLDTPERIPAVGRRYQIVERLGSGGMGVVYRALDRDSGRHVALKTIPAPRPDDLYRLKQEFRAARDLNHPNLVQLFDLVVEGSGCFFTMALHEGVDLMTFLRGTSAAAATTREVHFAPSDNFPHEPDLFEQLQPPLVDDAILREIFCQLALALKALHDAGIVHRDIKPSNVLVEPTGHLVLLDFGLAAPIDLTGRTNDAVPGKLLGTVPYMSPEQASGKEVGIATDFYSLGAVLHEAICGRQPFDGPAVVLLHKKTSVDPPALEKRAPWAPEDLSVLANKLLSREPHARPDISDVLSVLVAGTTDTAANAFSGIWSNFVGRQREIDLLESILRENTHVPTIIRVKGESGIGKTTLIRHILARQGRKDTLTFKSQCHPQEAVPYNALDPLIDGLSQHLTALAARSSDTLPHAPNLSRLFPVLRGVPGLVPEGLLGAEDPAEQRLEAISELSTLLALVGTSHNLVLWIDDFQWADRDSLSILHGLWRQPSLAVAHWILSHRPEGTPNARRAVPKGTTTRLIDLTLGPMEAPDALGLLLKALGGKRLPEGAKALVARTGHLPFLVCELAHCIVEARNKGEESRNITVEHALDRRLARLPETASALIATIALAGGPIALDIALEASGARSDLKLEIDGLVRTKLIRWLGADTQDAVEIFHDRIRLRILERLPKDRQKALHLALAQVMALRTDIEPTTLARHLEAVERKTEASRHTERAGDTALASLAFERAARLYDHTLTLADPDDPRRASLLRRRGGALASMGKGPDAAECFLAAAGLSEGHQRTSDTQRAAQMLLSAGHFEQGGAVLREALAQMSLKLPRYRWEAGAQLAWCLVRLRLRGLDTQIRPPGSLPREELAKIEACWTVAVFLGYADAVLSFSFQTRHLLLALDAGDPAHIARAMATELLYARATGRQSKRADHLTEQLTVISTHLREPDDIAYQHLARGYTAFLTGRFREATIDLDAAEAIYRSRGTQRWERSVGRAQRIFSMYYLGDLRGMADRTRRLGALLDAQDNRMGASMLKLGATWLTALMEDSPGRALDAIEQAQIPFKGKLPPTLAFLSAWARSNVALYCDDPSGADQIATRAWRDLRSLRIFQNIRITLWWLRGLAQIHMMIKNRATGLGSARAGIRRALRELRREDAVWIDGMCKTFEAGQAAAEGDLSAVPRHFRAAIESYEGADMPLFAQAIRAALASWEDDPDAVARAEAEIASRGVKKPTAWIRMAAPDLTPLRPRRLADDPRRALHEPQAHTSDPKR